MSVIPSIYNFKDHYKGSTLNPLSVKFNYDLTGAIIICQIRKDFKSAIVHEWKTDVNITVVDLLTGDIVLNQVNEFKPEAGVYMYDLQITFIDGTSQTYLKGSLTVIQDISKATI